MLKYESLSVTAQGRTHEKNDDAFSSRPDSGIFVICDGVSEGGQGHLAARLVADSINRTVQNKRSSIVPHLHTLKPAELLFKMQGILLDAFAKAQDELLAEAQLDPKSPYRLAASTCVAVWIENRVGLIAHVGDSRAYLFRGSNMYQLTKDHIGYGELIKAGLSEAVARKHPLSNHLARAFGNSRFELPDVLQIEFQLGDRLFLMTDGAYRNLNERTISPIVKANLQAQELEEFAKAAAQTIGDDSTLMAITFTQEEAKETKTLLASERVALIEGTPLCRYMNEAQKLQVAAISEFKSVAAGTVIIEEGQSGDELYVLHKGLVEIQRKKKSVKILGPGSFFGEMGLIRRIKRTSSVIAQGESQLVILKGQDLNRLFQQDRALESSALRAMAEELIDRLVELQN